jgi:hypothetical protein
MYSKKDALMGGPGLDGYAYQADVYCVDCGRDLIHQVFGDREEIADHVFQDSAKLPQPIFFGESEEEQLCANCGRYCYGEGEDEGDYVEEGHEDPTGAFGFYNAGSVVVMTPLTKEAMEWCEATMPEDAQRWGKAGWVVEPRYVQGVLDAWAAR